MPETEAVAALVKDPLSFMRSNLLFVNCQNQSGIRSLTLEEMRDAWLPDGRRIRCFSIERGNDQAGSFSAYWCHYDANATHSVTLGNAADLMFTPMMDGCTLAVGSRTAAGNRTVSHANSAATGEVIYDSIADRGAIVKALVARSHQQYAQRLSLQQVHGNDPGLQLVEPPTYRRDALEPKEVLSSTTFGVRNTITNDWAFYVQKQGYIGNRLTLVGVALVAGSKPPEGVFGYLSWLFGA